MLCLHIEYNPIRRAFVLPYSIDHNASVSVMLRLRVRKGRSNFIGAYRQGINCALVDSKLTEIIRHLLAEESRQIVSLDPKNKLHSFDSRRIRCYRVHCVQGRSGPDVLEDCPSRTCNFLQLAICKVPNALKQVFGRLADACVRVNARRSASRLLACEANLSSKQARSVRPACLQPSAGS